MSTDIQTEILENTVEAPEEVSKMETPEATEAPANPWKKGYISKDEWTNLGRDPKEWVSEDEYAARGPIFKHIEKLNKKLTVMADYNQRIMGKMQDAERRGYERAHTELQHQRAQAVQESDHYAVQQLDHQIQQTQQKLQEVNTPQYD